MYWDGFIANAMLVTTSITLRLTLLLYFFNKEINRMLISELMTFETLHRKTFYIFFIVMSDCFFFKIYLLLTYTKILTSRQFIKTCVYIYLYLCLYLSIPVFIFIYTCVYIYLYLCLYLSIPVLIFICTCVYIYLYMCYICTCLYIYLYLVLENLKA